MVSISLISVIMAAFTTFFVNSVAFTSQQRATQVATQIANSEVDLIRALPASDRVNGHDVSSVLAQFSAASSAVSPWNVGMVQATDPLALTTNSGLTAALPTAALLQTVNSIVYSTNVYLGTCVIPTPLTLNGITANATCGLGLASTGIGYMRAVIAVTWNGARCPSTIVLGVSRSQCSYVTSTLLSTIDDPLFNLTQSAPPLPILLYVVDPAANQISAVNDIVSLPATISAAPPYSVAVTAGTLPAGLNLTAATGLISGIPTLVQASTSVTLTLTDAYLRTTSVTFTWKVLAAVAGISPGPQSGVKGTAITTLLVSASGGEVPYTWTDPGATLPAGLTLSTVNNQASISGTPTTVKQYDPVTLTVTDSKNRTSTVTFTWTIDYPPFAATNPGTQTSTVNAADTVTLGATGGSGSFTWSGGATLPAGLTMTPAGVISGTPTASGTTSVILQVTDNKALVPKTTTVAFSWTVYPAPTVTAPGDQTATVGQLVSVQLATTCLNVPCSYSMVNGPSTIGINSTGVLNGTITSGAQTFSSVTVTVTDSTGARATSSTFRWTVVDGKPSVPLAVLVANGDSQVTPSWTAPSTGTVTSYTASVTGGASCTTTGLSCVIPGLTNGVVYALTVTATNSSGTSPASAPVNAIPYPAVMSAANGMTLWLDGADPSVVFINSNSACTGTLATTSATIGCWKDKSGLGNNFIQTTTANQPGITTAWRGLNSANFADTGDVLNSINPNAQYQTVFIAANVTNGAAQGDRIVDLFGQATQDYDVRIGSNTRRDLNNNPNDWAASTAGPLDWANGVQAANVTPPVAVITSDQAIAVKTFQASVSNTFMSRGVVGQVGEVITFKGILSGQDRRAVEQYLAKKWGLSVAGPPSAPQNVAAANGDTRVTASWTAPATNNGSAVAGYTATVSPGGAFCNTNGALSCDISGLTNGTVYALTVTATNGSDTGPSSAAVTAIPYPAGVMSATNGMTLWLDGADPTVLLASSTCATGATTTSVGCWKDKSGQTPANNFSQTTSANQPGVSTWNGLPAVKFVDTGDVLNSVISSATYQTAFVAANVTNPSGSGVIINLLAAVGYDVGVQIGSGAGRSAPDAKDWSVGTGSPPLNWANGTQAANPSQPMAVITTDQRAAAQSGAPVSLSTTIANRGLIGQIGEVITFNKALTNTQRRAVETYLSNKWGVSLGTQAPTTPQAPTSVTATVPTFNNNYSSTISWTPPGTDGVATVRGYTVTSAGGQGCTSTGATSCTTSRLSSGTYKFTVTATNSVGTGPPSDPSNAVTR